MNKSVAINKKTKVLVVGDFYLEMQERALADAFEQIGCETYRFAWCDYFFGYNTRGYNGLYDFLKWVYYRFQNKFLFGPTLVKLNRDLLAYAKKVNPDLIFVYHGSHIFSSTIRKLKESGFVLFAYNNDDPFAAYYPKYYWRHYLRPTKYFDHILVFRQKNVEDYKQKLGYTKASILMPDYIESRNFPIEKLPTDKYVCDVVFVGHYENDGRDDYIKELINSGIRFKLYGPNWENSPNFQYYKEKLGEIRPLLLNEYNLALNSAKIALVFLSHLNNDTYTRRCFEIPAMKVFMLSVYTDDLNHFFEEGKEAAYFRNKEDMMSKIRYYLSHNEERARIARAGYERLKRDGHETKDRARQIIELFNNQHNSKL
ncbi:MAG: glycosyltransferase [Candidatus Paceibacterota bacterium]|jgi:spore maturation protein CgeB